MANTPIQNTPVNQNFLHPNKFQFTFSRVPNIQYFCQAVTVPGISMGEVPVTTPFVEKYSPGEKAIYDMINVTFAIDEEMRSWIEIHDWIRAMTFPTDFTEYRNLGNLNRVSGMRASLKPQYSDASITILSSANKPHYRFKFYDVFPTTLSTFIMAASDSPDSQITADGTFRYSYYDIEKLT